MTKILLIQPSLAFWTSDMETDPNIPLGLLYIATVLKQKHDVKIFDRNLYFNDQILENLIKKYNPDIVGVTSMTGVMLKDALKVSKIVKQINPHALVIWGGPHASLRPKNTLQNQYIDFVIRGEGELAMLEIADLLEKSDPTKKTTLNKISKMKNINTNPMREFIDLNKIPFPDYDLLEMNKYSTFCINTSRGCPHRCAFCYNDGFWGKEGMKRVRGYTAENAIKLITQTTQKYKKKRIQILDDTFAFKIDRAIQICKGIAPLNLKFHSYLRANYATNELMSNLKKAGAWVIQFGFESGSQKMLDFMRKDVQVQQMIDAIKQCKKHKIICEGSFMIGLPTETIQDLNLTMKFIKQHPPDIGGAKIFHPYPSTMMYDYCIDNKLITEPKNIEEWADFNIQDKTNINVSQIPDHILIDAQKRIDQQLIIRGYVKKFFLMLGQGYIPYKETIHGLKHAGIILRNKFRK